MELDVRRTRDGALAVHHDPDVRGVLLADLSLGEARERAQRRIATLEEALALDLSFDVEVKEPGFEDLVLACCRRSGRSHVLKSFEDHIVAALRAADPDVPLGLVLGRRNPPFSTRVSELFPERRLRDCGATFVSPNHQLLHLGYVRRMHRKGYEVWPWTVNHPARMSALVRLGVDAIITDRPDIALRIAR